MFQRIFASRKARITLIFIMLFSGALSVFSFVTPLNRKNQAIVDLGEKTLSQTQALALAIEYYDASPLYALSRTPVENTTYENLCGLLSRTKKMFGYNKAYILYSGIGGKLGFLADSDYRANGQPGTDYQPMGTEYNLKNYNRKSRTVIEELFDGKTPYSYLAVILEEEGIGSVTTYLPLRSTQGTVIGVLGVDAPLENIDFSQYGIFNLEILSMLGAAIFLISLVLLLFCLDKSRQENDKSDKNKYQRISSKSAKKENAITVDNLDDVDPDNYW